MSKEIGKQTWILVALTLVMMSMACTFTQAFDTLLGSVDEAETVVITLPTATQTPTPATQAAEVEPIANTQIVEVTADVLALRSECNTGSTTLAWLTKGTLLYNVATLDTPSNLECVRWMMVIDPGPPIEGGCVFSIYTTNVK